VTVASQSWRFGRREYGKGCCVLRRPRITTCWRSCDCQLSGYAVAARPVACRMRCCRRSSCGRLAISGSTLSLGLVGLVGFVAALISSLIGGVIVDAYDRRVVLTASDCSSVVCAPACCTPLPGRRITGIDLRHRLVTGLLVIRICRAASDAAGDCRRGTAHARPDDNSALNSVSSVTGQPWVATDRGGGVGYRGQRTHSCRDFGSGRAGAAHTEHRGAGRCWMLFGGIGASCDSGVARR